MSLPKILLVVSTPSQFPDIKRLAKMFRLSQQIEPIVAFNYSVNFKSEPYKVLSALGITCFDYSQGLMHPLENATESRATSTPGINNNRQTEQIYSLSTKDKIKKNYPHLFKVIKYIVFKIRYTQIDLFSLIIKIFRRKYKERRLLKNLDIKLIILGEDSVDYFTSGLVEIANEGKIKVLIFPYTLSGSLEFLVEAHFSQQFVNRNIIYKITGMIFPKWTFAYRHKVLLKSRPALVWAIELFGRSPPEPWIMNSGYSDAIVVESEFMQDYFKRAGIPMEKMKVLGFPVLDDLSFGLKNRKVGRDQLSVQHNLDQNKIWILCSVPPNQSPREALGLLEYDQILKTYFRCFDEFLDRVEILCLFHPRADRDLYLPVCHQLGLKIMTGDISSYLPLADIFVASVSSTIRWALACGLPVINFDIYRYDYNDFQNTSVKTVFEVKEFKNETQALLSHLKERQDLSKPDPYFGDLSKNVSDKIIAYIKGLISS